MKILKGILEEQLENALRLKEDYIKALSQLGHGNIIKKRIYNQDYYYNEYRNGARIIFEYLGKPSQKELQRLLEEKHRREEYKKMVKELNLQISFLQKALRAKEMQNV